MEFQEEKCAFMLGGIANSERSRENALHSFFPGSPSSFFPMDLPVPGIFGNVVLQLFTDNSDFLVLGREPWERWESTAADVCLEKWRNWI